MDREDFDILAEMHQRPFASNEAIGKMTGLSGTTVKTRLNRMSARGVIQGYYVLIPARVFGRFHRIAAYFDADPEPTLASVVSIPDVVNVWRGSPRIVNLNVYAEHPDDGPSPEMQRAFGRTPDAYVQPDPPREGPSPSDVLSPLDWRVLDALVDSPRAGLAELASASGLTERTVRRHRDQLIASEMLEVVPILDTSQESGGIAYSGYIGVRDRSVLERIEIPGPSYTRTHHDPPALSVVGYAESYGAVIDLERRIRQVAGVGLTVLTVARGGQMASARLHEWIRSRLEAWRQARTGQSHARENRPERLRHPTRR